MPRTPVHPIDTRTSRLMGRVRSKRTAAENHVAEALRRVGAHYRRNVPTLPGAPDFANRRRGWVVLVHGCFWHGHDCRRGKRPKHNADFWAEKLDRNIARDAETERKLAARGLHVLTLWECELADLMVLDARLMAFLTAEPLAQPAADGCPSE